MSPQIWALARTAVFTAIVPALVAGYLPLRVFGGDGRTPGGWSYLGAVPLDLAVVALEEPLLRWQFGDAYARYCAEVPRCLPRWPRLRRC